MENTAQHILTLPVLLAGTAILFAIVIERILELAKSVYDYLDSRYCWNEQWNKRARKVRDRLELRLDAAKDNGQYEVDMVLALSARFLGHAHSSNDVLSAVSAKKIRMLVMQTRFGVLGMLLGIVIAFGVGVDAFQIVELSLDTTQSYEPSIIGKILTGIAMGLGASPMHKLIAAMESAKRFRKMAARGGQ